MKQLPPEGWGDKVEELPLRCHTLQTRSLKKKNETQLLMQLSKLLGPKQRTLDKGEQVQRIPQSIIGIQDMME